MADALSLIIYYTSEAQRPPRFCHSGTAVTKPNWATTMDDIDKVLSYQIKKEIADRYFSFRKMIEQNSAAYLDAIVNATTLYEAGVGIDLIRVYIMLQDPALIRRFQDLIAINHDLFYDSYICSSPTIRERLFTGLCSHGITRRSRFKHLFFDIYLKLQDTVAEYRATRQDLTEEQETISEEIKLFYRKNDLRYILSFLRSLDRNTDATSLLDGGVSPSDSDTSLESKMELTPPQETLLVLPAIPAIPPLKEIKSELLVLIKQALKNQPGLDVRTFCTAAIVKHS